MSKFAALTYGKQAGIHFDLISKGVDFDEKYKITKDNAIVWDTRLIKTVPNDLAVEGTGLGCVVVTVSDICVCTNTWQNSIYNVCMSVVL